MLTLYPPIKPYITHQLAVDEQHTLYVEECGNPDGVPVIFLHGGPGAGCDKDHRRFFDPERYRIVLFDQRGCGRSTPHCCLENNTTHDLIGDIEKIRNKLSIDKWLLFGGSWGSTLALTYAITHPNFVEGMILRGIFLGRPQDYDWLFADTGAARLFPDKWRDLLDHIPNAERHDLLQAFHVRLFGEDDVARMAAAKAWSTWEASCATLMPNPKLVHAFSQPHAASALAQIECHYFVNRLFIEDNFILKNIAAIEHIPAVIVHGRYDVICPLDQAFVLSENWAEAELNIIRDAGHSACEPSIVSALIHATNTFVQ